jgi:hypothetical protein
MFTLQGEGKPVKFGLESGTRDSPSKGVRGGPIRPIIGVLLINDALVLVAIYRMGI